MTLATTALLMPEPDDERRLPRCPEFCDGTCADWNDEAGSLHHTSGYTSMSTASDARGQRMVWLVSASRTDENFLAGTYDVNLLPEHGAGATMTPGEARQMAALLLNAADLADPLPVGVLPVDAKQVRIGDEISTPDGWQKVVGQMAHLASDEGAAQVNVWTSDVDHDPDTDGWLYRLGDIVHIRRCVHGSCAIAFVEPTQ